MAKERRANVRLAAGASGFGAGPVTVGVEIIATLPDEGTQRRGFYCEKADRLVALYAGRFKKIVGKGESK